MSELNFPIIIDYLQGSIDGDVRGCVEFVSLIIYVVSRENIEDFFENNREKDGEIIYILLGKPEEYQKIFIGKTSYRTIESISDGIKNWFQKVVFIHKENHSVYFDTAHYSYLEAALIKEVKKNKNYDLLNRSIPDIEDLSESEVSKCDKFLSYIYLVLPALRIDIFYQNKSLQKPQEENFKEQYLIKEEVRRVREEPAYKKLIFVLPFERFGLKARMRVEHETSFIILAGSQTSGRWSGDRGRSPLKYVEPVPLYRRLKEKNIIKEDGKNYIFIEDFYFSSPRDACGIILGFPQGGWTTWQEEKSKLQLDHWRDAIRQRL